MTKELRGEIIRRYQSGQSSVVIAKELGIYSASYICRILDHAGIPRRTFAEAAHHKLRSSQEAEVIDKYIRGRSVGDIADALQVPRHIIQHLIHKQGLARPRGVWEHTDAIKVSYESTKSLHKTASELGLSVSQVIRVLDREHVKRENRIHGVNEDYFRVIDTPEKAYYLGFLYADGAITVREKKGQAYRVSVQLAQKDREVIEKFRDAINSDAPIYETIGRYGDKEYPVVGVHIASKQMILDLIDKGCVPRKSLVLTFPNWLSSDLRSHFIRGYFDGDGSITCQVSNWNSYHFSLLGTEAFLRVVQDILMEDLGFARTQLGHPSNIWVLRYGGNRQMRMLHRWIYREADGLYLVRKKQKWDGVFKRQEEIDERSNTI